MADQFPGFPRESLTFFRQLAENNNRPWFQAHKQVYERACREPMQELVAGLEPRFGKAKISRPNRDVRFSKDKTPYKTYIAAGFGGHYVSLSEKGLFVGGGLYIKDKAMLQRFREAIDDDSTGPQLQRLVASLRKKRYDVGSHDMLSTVPRGFDVDHPRRELLRMKDIFCGRLFAPAAWLHTAAVRERIEAVLRDTGPLVMWLRENVERRRSDPS